MEMLMISFIKNLKSRFTPVSIRTHVPIPLQGVVNTPEFVSFNGLNSQLEHIALVFKSEQQTATDTLPVLDNPMVRLHSECLTGDAFHSQRCDCGEQLNESIQLLSESGGVLLYLRQEGRGIGLYNKLDAYVLQYQGMNTFEANRHLGFDEDMRDYKEAAQMLKALKVSQLRLLTNNGKKRAALQVHGLDVTETINTGVFSHAQNYNYLKDKIDLDGHEITLS